MLAQDKNNDCDKAATRTLQALIFSLLLGFGLPATAESEVEPLIVVQDHAWAPFAFADGDGEPQGLLIDLWRALGEQLGRPVVFELYDWPQTLERTRNADNRIHGGLFISDERREFLDFSASLMPLRTMLFVNNREHLGDIQSPTDLGGTTVGITRGGFEVTYMRSQFPQTRLQTFENNEALVRAAVRGQVSAFVADYPVGAYYLSRHTTPEHYRATSLLYQRPLAAAVAKGNDPLLAEINQALTALPPERLESISQRWIQRDTREVLPAWLLPALATSLLALVVTGLLIHGRLLRQRLEEQAARLREQEQHLHLFSQSMSDFAWRMDSDGLLSYVSPSVHRVLGFHPEEMVGQVMTVALDTESSEKAVALQQSTIAAARRGELGTRADLLEQFTQIHKNGRKVHTEVAIQVFFDAVGNMTGAQGVSRDVSARHETEQALRKLVTSDPITQLPTRQQASQRLNQVIADCAYHQEYAALLFLDLDNFKFINDQQGHDMGDLLLRQIAERLDSHVSLDTLARFGGDEFVIISRPLGSQSSEAWIQAEQLAQAVTEQFKAPFSLHGRAITATASVGVTLFNSRQDTPQGLFRKADLAMCRAKTLGLNQIAFSDPV
ncbi:diguanylate cyclase domain-containing protein [Marinimicrobium alkaliphilum]|uniref:diguanylate cyclase domain-containing protein n=1 Tax=Marinimicrobium alkaliphilum TaxID=2202654 RepID=UPI000DBA51AB|nr:transporter substrate-binding domain-containing protein [Marinimicrobium alkaliphilum]